MSREEIYRGLADADDGGNGGDDDPRPDKKKKEISPADEVKDQKKKEG